MNRLGEPIHHQHQLELIPGKMMETDGVNLYSLTATLRQKTLDGWAYSFYELADGPVKMTAMKPGAWW